MQAPELLEGGKMPLFENQHDVKNQTIVGQRIAKAWSCEFGLWGPNSIVDLWMERKKQVISVVEVKTNWNEIGKYPLFIMSLKKVSWVEYFSERFDVPAYIAAFYPMNNVILYKNVKDIDLSKHMVITRADNRAKNDREPVVKIPVNSLIKLDERGNDG